MDSAQRERALAVIEEGLGDLACDAFHSPDASRVYAAAIKADAGRLLDAVIEALGMGQRTDAERIAWALANAMAGWMGRASAVSITSFRPFGGAACWYLNHGGQSVPLGIVERDPALTDEARAIIDRHMDKEQPHA